MNSRRRGYSFPIMTHASMTCGSFETTSRSALRPPSESLSSWIRSRAVMTRLKSSILSFGSASRDRSAAGVVDERADVAERGESRARVGVDVGGWLDVRVAVGIDRLEVRGHAVGQRLALGVEVAGFARDPARDRTAPGAAPRCT